MLYLTKLPPAPRSSARRRFLNKWQVFVFPAIVNTAWWVKLAPPGSHPHCLWRGVSASRPGPFVPLELLSSCLYWTVDASHSGFACSATRLEWFPHSVLSLLICKCVARFNKVQSHTDNTIWSWFTSTHFPLKEFRCFLYITVLGDVVSCPGHMTATWSPHQEV